MNVELGKFIEEKIKKEIENIRIIFKMQILILLDDMVFRYIKCLQKIKEMCVYFIIDK